MKLARIRRVLLLIFIIIVILPSIFPIAASASVSAPASAGPNVSMEEDPAVPAGSTASQSSARRHKRNKGLSLSQLLRKYPDTIKTQGPRRKIIALTFDDVPDPRFTPQLLDVLHKYNVKATFFVVGSRAEKHPGLVARIIREGHAIGNHSYNHPEFGKLGMNEFRTQIIRTENIIQALAGYKPRLIRPPYGDISEQQLKWARAHGYKLVNWNVDSLDWRGLSKTQVRNNILSRAGKGAIILQHGGGGRGSNLQGTIQALPEVISIMRKRGYSFVTVPQMFEVSKSK
ncbi:polysaccharide deacetylase family protein [Paenibacillus sp. LMG 31459]|uniref:Polysaccharide deacetylase family protein n=1 Tax=Paenibacillus phytohabitans TaxID=2654978 RepID=A0ABX1YCA9_9BACL|nr:polysaccharide deacetylase family protein [Paenibacillus phytohabitans]NOU77671.1 polysaccharide deacetylase family protein [Paenibacillus phytohabitans]